MLFWENIKFAFNALFANKVRTLLTMLGIIIGVFAVTILIGIGDGLRGEFSQQVESLGSNVLVVTPGKVDETTFNPAASFGVSTLTVDDLRAIQENVPTIEKSAPLTLLSGTIIFNGKAVANLLPISTTPNYFSILENELAAGEYFTEENLQNKDRFVVIGGAAAEAIFRGGEEDARNEEELAKDAVAKKIELLGEEFTIMGVLKEKEDALNFGGSDTNQVVLVPRDTATEITGETVVYRIVNKVRTAEDVDMAKQQVFDTILELHHGIEDFSVLTQDDVLGVFNTFFNLLSQAIIGIAAISLIVGGIGIMNIMLVSVTERTREIGLRKAIGASGGNIMFQFLVEASTISVFGGLIGVGLSLIAAPLIEQFFEIPTNITFEAIIVAFVISVLTGILFGIMPASKAARKSPIEALRYE